MMYELIDKLLNGVRSHSDVLQALKDSKTTRAISNNTFKCIKFNPLSSCTLYIHIIKLTFLAQECQPIHTYSGDIK